MVTLDLFDGARNSATCFDFYLTVRDRAGNVTTFTDQQPLADHQFALKPATYIGILGGSMAIEETRLRDNHVLALLQRRLDRTFDDEPIAGSDFARKRDSLSNDECPAIDFVPF